MKIEEIAAATFGFHRAAYVSLTETCPLRCRHCFVESAPDRSERVPDDFARWIESVASTPGVDVLFFSGGEPFSHPAALRAALESCDRNGVMPIVCTSGFFGRSEATVARLLDAFPLVKCLWLSTDVFHEEFVPLEWLRNVAVVAKARGIAVGFQIVDDAPESSPFMARFADTIGHDLAPERDIVIVPLAEQGRATSELSPAEREALRERGAGGIDAVPAKPCQWLGTPWVREDGNVSACPNLDVFRAETHPLQIGNLARESYPEISARADADAYLQWMRVYGPRGIVEHFPVEEYGFEAESFAGRTICDLCHALSRVPGLADRVRAASESDEQQTRLGLLRFAVYGSR
jgi:pyruvate-formate lyase-activating enzyme